MAPMWRNPAQFVEQFWDVRLMVRHAKLLGDKIGNEVIGPVSIPETMGGWPLFEQADEGGLLLSVEARRCARGMASAQRLSATAVYPTDPIANRGLTDAEA